MSKKIFICGGGTLGHIFPAVEVGNRLQAQGFEIIWIGSDESQKKYIQENWIFQRVSSGKLRRYFSLKTIIDLFRFPYGIIQSMILIIRNKPCLIFSKGGYVSLPMVIAGSKLGIPIIAHESDVVMGISNKVSSKYAQKICVSFPVNYYDKSIQNKLEYTGLPIRQEFLELSKLNSEILPQARNILVIGGSQGAISMNCMVENLLDKLLDRFNVYHLTGKKWFKTALKLKASLSIDKSKLYNPIEFTTDDLVSLVTSSDIIVTRGGSSIIELSYAKKPMIIVPLPSAAANHQFMNAKVFEDANAARVVEEKQGVEILYKQIVNLADDVEQRKNLSINISKYNLPDPASKVAEIITNIIKTENR